ncbi:hypothetical protein [Streptomyces sp. NPDC057460]|uniref:hypothetical protein n=1 Tax=Streptomyces sp. NPDC057460 TaxID=3346141 RepID=UPI00368BDC1A
MAGQDDPHRRTAVVRVLSVYEADGFDVRRPAPGVPTAGIRDAEDLPAPVEIAQSAEGRTGPARHCTPIRTVRSHVS